MELRAYLPSFDANLLPREVTRSLETCEAGRRAGLYEEVGLRGEHANDRIDEPVDGRAEGKAYDVDLPSRATHGGLLPPKKLHVEDAGLRRGNDRPEDEAAVNGASTTGRYIVNVAPSPGALSTQIDPLDCFTMP